MKGYAAGIFGVALIASITVGQALQYKSTLEKDSLLRGRIVLSSGDTSDFNPGKNREGSAALILDGDRTTFTRLFFPSPNPEGTFILADLALSHDPPLSADGAPRSRKPDHLTFLNGICDCSDFKSRARARDVKIELLVRRANDPDAEGVIPDAHVIYTRQVTLPDSAEPFIVLLTMPAFPVSSRYPENVSLLILKLSILSVYPGADPAVAIREVEYTDSDALSSTLRTWSSR